MGVNPPAWRWSGMVVLAVLALALSGCGYGDSSSTGNTEARGPGQPHASGMQMSPPGGQRRWRERGVKDCRGKQPLAFARALIAAARRGGARRHFIELVTQPPPAVERSTGYPRLVAAFYALTLPSNQRVAASAGCASELEASLRGGKAATARSR